MHGWAEKTRLGRDSCLEIRREADRTKLIGLALALEFPGPEDLSHGQTDALVDNGDAELCVADKSLLVDAVAPGEGVPVEKYVVDDGASLDAGEGIPGQARSILDRRETAERRADQGGP